MKKWIRIQFTKLQAKLRVTILSFFMLISVPILISLCSSPAQADCRWAGVWDITIGYPGVENTGRAAIEQNGSQVIFNILVGTASGDTVRFSVCSTVKTHSDI